MQLTAHKTVTQFMRYVDTEDDSVRAAAETVAARRRASRFPASDPLSNPQNSATMTEQPTNSLDMPLAIPAGFDDGPYGSNVKLRNYRPFRCRSGANRTVPPGTKRTGKFY
jgi:hypothetical protein